MLISRIKQVYQYIFSNFDDNWNKQYKKIKIICYEREKLYKKLNL